MDRISFKFHYFLGFFIRILLIIYSEFHDNHFDVPYTDIDYKVFTDAARYVMKSQSPYDRHTYRYTPLLAIILTPNIYLHTNFGKFLFCIVDLIITVFIRKILARQSDNKRLEDVSSFLWLYNPLILIISSRGNADSVTVFLVVLTLNYVQTNNLLIAGFTYALAVHFRLYPIIFSLIIYLSLSRKKIIVPNSDQLKFVLSFICSFVFLNSIFYYYYGYPFLYESFIYHLIRRDAKHNFSVFFYMLYLSATNPPNLIFKIFTFLPQFVLLLVTSCRYSDKSTLPFAMFIQAMVMVTYNPVMTSQYFFWFLSLLPLCLPNIKMDIYKAINLIVAWILSQGIWLWGAYYLEFSGANSFVYIWISSLIFFVVNIKILVDIIHCYKIY